MCGAGRRRREGNAADVETSNIQHRTPNIEF
jgi:hypothetical protein